jgi:hypothetical protein
MAKFVLAALCIGSTVATLNKVNVLSALSEVAADEKLWAPTLDVSAIKPGARVPGLKSYSTVLMHGLGDAGKNPGE